MSVALQIKDVREEVRDAIAARAAARGQSMQVYLREILEREYRAERNARLFDQLVSHRSLDLDAQDIVDYIRSGRDGIS
jgi:plasmid stability protein